MPEKNFLSASPGTTKRLGRELAKKILKAGQKNKARLLALEGDLGGGKTTFLQGFAKGLGIEEKILSPTFVIMRRFKLQGSGFLNFYHLDCYRIKDAEEILDLHFREILSHPKNIVAIEWSEMIKPILPQGDFRISFKFINDKKRKITICD